MILAHPLLVYLPRQDWWGQFWDSTALSRSGRRVVPVFSNKALFIKYAVSSSSIQKCSEHTVGLLRSNASFLAHRRIHSALTLGSLGIVKNASSFLFCLCRYHTLLCNNSQPWYQLRLWNQAWNSQKQTDVQHMFPNFDHFECILGPWFRIAASFVSMVTAWLMQP